MITVRCDHCSNDLSATGNAVAYRLALNVESIPSAGGVVTAMMVYPPLPRDAHFCGIECLRRWLAGREGKP